MPRPFFPDPIFGWTFFAVLMVLAVLAAFADVRSAVVPKRLTLSMLALGIVFNAGRGLLVGQAHEKLWCLPGTGPVLGALDGLLLCLAGFGVGFGLFFLFWVVGLCGGGDVKLFAALGSWVGPVFVILVMLVSALVLMVLLAGRLLLFGLPPQAVRPRRQPGPRQARQPAAAAKPREKTRVTYSLPVAVGTALVLLWFCRKDLHLADPNHQPDTARVQAHGH
jgi:prepilin peptidase CpaA